MTGSKAFESGNVFRLEPRRHPEADPEAALAAIGAGPAQVDTETLVGWIRHPDERVPLAVIERYPRMLRGGPGRKALDARIDELDRSEPSVWSPLIDRAPGVKYRDSKLRERAMERWFRSATHRDALRVLERFPSDLPGWVAARHLADWTPEVVRAVAGASPRSPARLGANPAISGDSAQALFALVLDWLEDESLRGDYIDNRLRIGLQRFCERAPNEVRNIGPRLLRVVRQAADGPASVAARGLGAYAHLNDALGHQFLGMADGRTEVVAEFLKGGRASVAVVERALEEAPMLAVRRAIARHTKWLDSDIVRRQLAESDCARVLTALIETAPTNDETDRLLHRLTQSNPQRAIEAIEGHLPNGYRPSKRVLTVLLTNQHRRVREKAVQLLGPARSEGKGRR